MTGRIFQVPMHRISTAHLDAGWNGMYIRCTHDPIGSEAMESNGGAGMQAGNDSKSLNTGHRRAALHLYCICNEPDRSWVPEP